MSIKSNRTSVEVRHEQVATQKVRDDRETLIIFLAILGLALPALAIRNLFPDLNPLLLAGLGITVYGVYLGWFLWTNQLLSAEKEVSRQSATVYASNNHPIDEQRGQE